MVHNGRVYLYTGHDEDGSTNFTMREWRVWSSADMVNWTDHGSPMSLATFSWASSNAWAGHTIFRNGNFYWYVPVTNRATGRMAIGVGVSSSPTGPLGLQAGRLVLQRVRGGMLLGVHRVLDGAEPDRAVDLPRNDHAEAGW